MAYRIGSFNVYKLSYESSKSIRKNWDLIASIIKEEGFDIVALQEVFSKEALKRNLMPMLGNNWDYRWASPKSKSVQQAEGYAFLWNTNRMELSYATKIDMSNGTIPAFKQVAEPHIYDQYRIDRNKGQYELARNPFYGRFKPKDSFCEIRLINTHIRFSGDKEEHFDGNDKIGDGGQRENEFKILSEVILYNLSTKAYGNHMPSYTILLGDYNLNLNRKRENAIGPYVPYSNKFDYEVYSIDDNGTTHHIRTIQDQLTTLKQSVDNTVDDPELRGYANDYDHFTYSEDDFTGVGVHARKIDSVRKYCGDDFAKHRLEVSDHVPIAMDIDLLNK